MTSPWDKSTVPRANVEEGPAIAGYVLTVLDGNDVGQRAPVEGSMGTRVLAGKSPVCTLRLTDPEVSRRHTAFEMTPGGLRVVDLGSTNGTTVNGLRVVEAYANAGDRVRLAGTTIAIERGEAAPSVVVTDTHFGRMLGASDAMRRIYPLCARLSASDIAVLIEGETGTGKEVLAEAIHEASARVRDPFVVFDCTAVPAQLAESTLFGHERGAFTGATGSRKGVFEEAHGGTLFIDELGELDLAIQPKLLRALERGEVQRVGSNQWTRVDVRIIAATRRDLDQEVNDGRFRDDLFFRLAVGRIELPPLRERLGDIALLANHFWALFGGRERPVPNDVLHRLEAYRWPGNVRELSNAVARVLALGTVGLDDVPTWDVPASETSASLDFFEDVLSQGLPLPSARERIVAEFERRYVERVLADHGGNVSRAATASGIALRYFRRLKARHKASELG